MNAQIGWNPTAIITVHLRSITREVATQQITHLLSHGAAETIRRVLIMYNYFKREVRQPMINQEVVHLEVGERATLLRQRHIALDPMDRLVEILIVEDGLITPWDLLQFLLTEQEGTTSGNLLLTYPLDL
jgi:hypothetical protein